jgi:magnesium-transporting ATPase (P-type)
MSEDALYEI